MEHIYEESDGRMERDGTVVVWENPDIPAHDRMFGETLEFDCPDCDDKQIFKDVEDRDQFEDWLEQADGTLRCDGCNEPLYGIYGDGDH